MEVEWFYIVLFTWPDQKGVWNTQESQGVLYVKPGTTRQEVHYKIQDVVIEESGMRVEAFRTGHFASYHVEENAVPYKGPR